jgi:hypothetical protein
VVAQNQPNSQIKNPETVRNQGFLLVLVWHRLDVSNDSQLPNFSPPNNLNYTVYLHFKCFMFYLETFYFICFLSNFFNFMVTFLNLSKTRYYKTLLTYIHKGFQQVQQMQQLFANVIKIAPFDPQYNWGYK